MPPSSLNLITSPWLPVRRASGLREMIAPHQLTKDFTDDPIMALDFGRPDLDGAVTEFLIGLFAVGMGPEDTAAWAAVWRAPPSPEALHEVLAPLAFAFNLGGDGPRCFQDLDELQKAELTPILHILIDYPGENALKLNTDHFAKRDVRNVSSPEAAAALIMLQTWAPSGGAGHRTSMRGGGPLTTLARSPRVLSDGRAITTLWDLIWINIPETNEAPAHNEKLFPWLGPARTSSNQEVVNSDPAIAHSLQAFFGTPRRIRLEFDSQGVAVAYRTLPNGANYPAEAWRHPLSPYYKEAKGSILPVHPRAGPESYRDWLGVLVNGDNALRATCINTLSGRLERIGIARKDRRTSILAFGYDQDNAKSRGFVSQSVPWINAANPHAFSAAMSAGVAAAEAAARGTRHAVQMARHGEVSLSDTGSAFLKLRDEGKKAAEDVYHAFFALTEPDFRVYLDTVALLEHFEDGREARSIFAAACRRVARQLFAAHVDDASREHVLRRSVLAEKWLGIALHVPKAKTYVFNSLQLTVQETQHG